MKSCPIIILVLGIAFSLFGAEPQSDWRAAKQTSGLTIYSRSHPGSQLKEFKAVGDIDAPTKTIYGVIDDFEAYSSFMPYTAECRVLERKNDSVLTYQRLSPKIIADRDYTIRVEKKSWPAENGTAYSSRWTPANDHGPAKKSGVVRVQLCEGSWLLEPVGANKTRATYFVFSDSSVAVPAFLANSISETGISKLFAAVRKQAKNPKYQTK